MYISGFLAIVGVVCKQNSGVYVASMKRKMGKTLCSQPAKFIPEMKCGTRTQHIVHITWNVFGDFGEGSVFPVFIYPQIHINARYPIAIIQIQQFLMAER